MSFNVFVGTYGWLIVAVCAFVLALVVNRLVFKLWLSKALAPLEDTKEAYVKMWIHVGISAVLAVGSYYGVSWVFTTAVHPVWYCIGCLGGCLLALVIELKKAGLKLANVKEAKDKIEADIAGVREVARRAGIIDDEKFNSVMAEVNAEIKSKFESIEKIKDEKTKAAFVDALVGFLVKDGSLDETDIKVLKASGITTEDLNNSKVMFDFLNNK